MGLPKVQLKTETLTLPDGQTLELKALSRAEVVEMLGKSGVEAEQYAISASTGEPFEEVVAWHKETPNDVVTLITDKIAEISFLLEDSQKK